MSEHEQGVAGKNADLTLKADLPKRHTRHSIFFRLAFTTCMGAIFAGFISLGIWQVQRLQWKLDLIARVEQRVHTNPVPAPTFSEWARINASADEYRHVQVTGNFLYEKTTLVQASTELGRGFWLLTPLAMADQGMVLVNRGFIPENMAASYRSNRTSSKQDRPASPDINIIHVSGLLRMTEPGGGFLRKNDPANDRWYSRDVQAIAAAAGLTKIAPFFIDEDATIKAANEQPDALQNDATAKYPVAGLTVIQFHNNHLVYAVVWFLLAAMTATAWFYVTRNRKHQQSQHSENTIP